MLAELTNNPFVTLQPTTAGSLALNDFTTRLEAMALLLTLNTEILASPSATLTLEKWCKDHRLAENPDANIVARTTWTEPRNVTPEQRDRLAIGDELEVKYRHVELLCADHILSEADNWYLPSRLSAEMNRVCAGRPARSRR